ncbi:MAG: HEAT repeat domain-containing protein [bacterium]|nr:MAG: HEAT repeat domain-containing protein [bacterium]
MMALQDSDWGARENAVKELVEMGETISQRLIQTLQQGNSLARWEAARVLGKIKS